MENLKIGDKVIFKDNACCPTEVIVGDTGIIVGGSKEEYFRVKLDRNGRTWITDEKRLVKYSENNFIECAKNLHDMYIAMVDAGFSEMQAWEMIMASIKNSLKL